MSSFDEGDFLDELRSVGSDLGYREDAFLGELRSFAIARRNVLLVPEDHVDLSVIEKYLRELLKREPTVDEIDFASANRRRRRVTISDRIKVALEARQNQRCALCGVVLIVSTKPHVDHIRPISNYGDNLESNLRLLCSQCNLGKSDSFSWHLAMPFNFRTSPQRLRYSVLARANGNCQIRECAATASVGLLKLSTRVPAAHGGRWVFDNLRAVCDEHAAKIQDDRRRQTLRALRSRSASRKRIVS